MAKSPAFQFYAADYLADEEVQLLTLEQEGAYIRLLAYCWREGSIPAEPAKLSRLCKDCPIDSITAVLELFEPAPVLGRLIHMRLEQERQKQELFKASCSKRGSAGAEKRWQSHSSAIDEPMANDSFASLSLSLSSSSSSSYKEQKPPAKRVADPRHALFKQELSDYWLARNGNDMPWGAADAKQLSNLLTSAPAMAAEQFQGCLKNRLDSESVNHAETPRRWLGKLLSYAAGPLDRFNRPKGDNTNGTFDAKSSYTADSAKTYIEQGRNSNAVDAFSHSETGEIGRRRLPSVC